MLPQSFIHLPGVGHCTERRIWSQGIRDWDAFLARPAVEGIGGPRKLEHDGQLRECRMLLDEGKTYELASRFPRSETWRLFHDLAPALYLDIETTGLSPHDSKVTCIGISDGEKTDVLVRGQNLTMDALLDAFNRSKLLVTFNGMRFDIPFIEHNLRVKLPELPHLDLMYAFWGVGIRGGLKRIETQLGVSRPEELQGVGGMEAVWLWQDWERRGDRAALDRLIEYNKADVVNMKPLAELMYGMGRKRLLDGTGFE